MLTLLYARAGRDIRGELLERMGASPARRRLLIVPEQYSHESERAMCAALGGGTLMDCEVLSFTRLAGRLTDFAGGGAAPMLDAGGRMLLMYAALRQVADALAAYRAPSRKPAFLTGLLATVDECRSYRVEPEALMAAGEELGGRQGDKLKDLGLIYAAYRALEARGAADPRGRLDRLAVQLEDTRWGAGMAFYVYGFTDFTPQEERVLSALMAQGELTVAFVCDAGDDRLGVFQPALRCARRLDRLARRDAVPVREETLDRPLPRHPSLAFFGGAPFRLRAGRPLGGGVRRHPGVRRRPPPGGGVVRRRDPAALERERLPLPGHRRVRPAAGRVRGADRQRVFPVWGAGVPLGHGGHPGKAGAGPGDLGPGGGGVGLPL